MIGRFSLTILVGIGAFLWAALLVLHGWSVPVSFFSPASMVVSIILAALFVFDRWAWAWRGIALSVSRPDVRGTWKGVLRSNWKAEASNSPAEPIEAYLSIYETYSCLIIRLFTAESQSVTLNAVIDHGHDGTCSVIGVYRNEPKLSVRDRSPMHYGSFVLRIEAVTALAGHYWTDRSTNGEMEFQRVSAERATNYASARTLVP